jgi:hypothetical protein
MDGRDWVQIIGAIAAGIVLIINTYMSWRTGQAVEKVHTATNSMKDALVKVTGEAEKAKGRLEGAAEAEAKARGESTTTRPPMRKPPDDPTTHF